MPSHQRSVLATVAGFLLFVAICLLLNCQSLEATRPVRLLGLQSLQRGPSPPSGPSPCTNHPGQGGNCPIPPKDSPEKDRIGSAARIDVRR
ncbi:hypothetical protein ACLOJK_032324, partial [Asimina triloba]